MLCWDQGHRAVLQRLCQEHEELSLLPMPCLVPAPLSVPRASGAADSTRLVYLWGSSGTSSSSCLCSSHSSSVPALHPTRLQLPGRLRMGSTSFPKPTDNSQTMKPPQRMFRPCLFSVECQQKPFYLGPTSKCFFIPEDKDVFIDSIIGFIYCVSHTPTCKTVKELKAANYGMTGTPRGINPS